MKIAFLIASLSAGGAERVASLLCNQWHKAGHNIDVLTFQQANSPRHYELAAGIGYHPLDLMKESSSILTFIANNLRRVISVRQRLRQIQPDVMVSFVTDTNVIAILAARSLGIPAVVSERIHPGAHRIGWVRETMRKMVYPAASMLVVQTADIATWAKSNIKVEMLVIPNPVDLPGFSRKPAPDVPDGHDKRKRLLAVGRLTPQKGYDILLEAFGRLSARQPDWDLTILGEGHERENLMRKIEAKNLAARVHLPGNSDKIAKAYASADLFVHPSRYEGYPNALVEALASGLCCIATDCPGASRELLQDGKYGLVAKAGDADDLAEKLGQAMSDKKLRRKFAEISPLAVQHCDLEGVSAAWLDVFENIRKPG